MCLDLNAAQMYRHTTAHVQNIYNSALLMLFIENGHTSLLPRSFIAAQWHPKKYILITY